LKGDKSRHFYTFLVANVLYSTLVAGLVEVFAVTNLTKLGNFFTQSGRPSFLVFFDGPEALVILVYVMLGIAVFVATFFFLMQRPIRYIDRISDAIKKIAAGDLGTYVEVVGDDEFSAMAENLNHMVEDLKRLIEKERQSERTKNELITSVAHDLRTPLTSIIGYLELIQNTPDLPPAQREKFLSIISTKSKRLEKLIEELFGFTKLTFGKMSMKVTRLDIVKLVSQLLEEFYPNFQKSKLECVFSSSRPEKMIRADGALLARLFDNLIANAIKYGAEGKKIIVRVEASDTQTVVSVTNFGYVIPEKELPLLFDKFYRVEQSRSLNTGGTGLGLAIAKNIAEVHGGDISVKSSLQGTVFTVTLPDGWDEKTEKWAEPVQDEAGPAASGGGVGGGVDGCGDGDGVGGGDGGNGGGDSVGDDGGGGGDGVGGGDGGDGGGDSVGDDGSGGGDGR
jgi:signal transduction histidine kinase